MHERRQSMKRRTWLVAAGLVVTAGFGALWQHERVESWLTGLGVLSAKALRCEPELGLRASYRLRMHTQMKINAAALLADARKQQGELIATDAGFSGRLRLQALEQRKLGMLVGLSLDELEVDAGVADLPAELRKQMGEPFYAVLAPDCSFRDFGFAPSVGAEVVNRLQGLLQGMSLAMDEDGSKQQWQSQEYDAVGSYSARYERPDSTSRRVTKHRMAYLRAHPSSGFGIKEPMRVRVLKSTTPAELDEEAAWLKHLESREHLHVTRGSNGALVADLKLTLWLERSQEDASDLTLVNAPADVRWRKQTDPPLVADPRRPDPPDAMKTLPLDAALSQYAALLRSGGKNSIAQAADFLALYLRARPEMALELMKMLQARVIPRDLEAPIFLALEMAGTKQAHDALISGLGNDHSSENRSRAAAALPDIPRPEPRTLDALRETARSAVADTPDDTRLVRNSATFAIGTLERRTRVAYPALAKQAVAELRSGLSGARGDQAQAVALDAIGNSGNPELLSDVKPLLAAPEGLVRAHAIEAMGHMPPEANQDMFGALIGNEQDARIRGTIAATYADQAKRVDQPPPALVIDQAITHLGQEQDPRVRGLLIDLIGPACAKNPQAMQALSNQFKRESDPMLLKLIGKWVPAGQLGT